MDFPGHPGVRTPHFRYGVQVQSLVRELGSHMPASVAKIFFKKEQEMTKMQCYFKDASI